MALVAPKGSGKSTIIYNIISRPEFYYKKFHQVWMLSPTFRLDDTYARLRLNPDHIIIDTDKFTSTMKNILTDVDAKIAAIERTVAQQAAAQGWSQDKEKEQVEIEKAQKLDRILIVIDDAVGVKALQRDSVIVNSFTRHRHYHISFLYAVQLYKAMPPVVRVNLSAIILFRVYNKGEIAKIVEEQAAFVPEKTWLALYEHATNEQYSFFYVNYKHPLRFFKNFTTPLVAQEQTQP